MDIKKVLFILVLINFTIVSSYGQSSEKKNTRNNSIAISKEALANYIFNKNGNADITNFKIKFPGYPTVLVKGNRLNAKALSFLKGSKKGITVQVFDIKEGFESTSMQHIKPLLFKLTSS